MKGRRRYDRPRSVTPPRQHTLESIEFVLLDQHHPCVAAVFSQKRVNPAAAGSMEAGISEGFCLVAESPACGRGDEPVRPMK